MAEINWTPDMLAEKLGSSAPLFDKMVEAIRSEYEMDELFDGRDQLRFRRGGKTLITLVIREGNFSVMVIYGKQEREKFEAVWAEFPEAIQKLYDGSKTFHDGKWMMMDMHDDALIPDILRMLHIKRKPNRK